jgi:hypothetical protein
MISRSLARIFPLLWRFLKFIVYRAITAINEASEVVVERVHKDVYFPLQAELSVQRLRGQLKALTKARRTKKLFSRKKLEINQKA